MVGQRRNPEPLAIREAFVIPLPYKDDSRISILTNDAEAEPSHNRNDSFSVITLNPLI